MTLPSQSRGRPDDADEPQPGLARQYVSPIKSIEQQVGEHVIGALQQEQTVGVLTTVVVGTDGGQNIMSVGLDTNQLESVNQLLSQVSEPQESHVPCVGFHCFINRPPPPPPPPPPDTPPETK
jgi:hypothetical protein